MTNHNLSLPVWQSRALLCAGLAALGAAALGSGVYAFQSASASQLLRLTPEMAIPTDAVTKTVLSFSAELGVAFGAVVTAWLWRTGRKGLRLQAYLAVVMTAWALAISVGNLSGYFAWTRAQHIAETARASESYRVASDRREAGAYLSRSDEATLRRGEAPGDAERELGDVSKAFGLHILVLGFGAAYRLPAPRKAKRRRNKSRATGKPKLAVVK
jgi:hypothetical protein